MAYLNLELDYFDHPKTRRLIGLLGKGAESLPLRLWCYSGKYHSADGKLSGHSTQEIESTLQWRGEPGKAVEALLKVGFLEKDGTGFRVHGWKEYQGHIEALKRRNKKVAVNRWKNINKEPSTVDTSGIPKSTSGVPRSVTLPCLTGNSKSLNVKTVATTATPTTLRARPKQNGSGEYDKDVVDEIVAFCGDAKSRGYFIAACRELGGGLLREALGELKMRLGEGQSISNKGAYLTSLIEDWGKS